MGTKISTILHNSYDNYYQEGNSEWRRVCAEDKAYNIVLLCKLFSHNSILEIGAGEGSILQKLSNINFGSEFYALEISSSGVDTIRRRNIEGLIDCLLFDGYKVPYEDKKFDLVILSHVVEHLEFPRKLLYEARRVAKYVFVEVPLEDNFRMPKDFVLDSVGHINFYSPKTIRRLLQTCDLNVLNQIVVNPSKTVSTFHKGNKGKLSFYVKHFLLKISPWLAVKFFTYHSALICQSDLTE